MVVEQQHLHQDKILTIAHQDLQVVVEQPLHLLEQQHLHQDKIITIVHQDLQVVVEQPPLQPLLEQQHLQEVEDKK
jgi:hypothetical protein